MEALTTLMLVWYWCAWLGVALHARRWQRIDAQQFCFYMLWPVTIPLVLLMNAVGDKTIWEATND